MGIDRAIRHLPLGNEAIIANVDDNLGFRNRSYVRFAALIVVKNHVTICLNFLFFSSGQGKQPVSNNEIIPTSRRKKDNAGLCKPRVLV